MTNVVITFSFGAMNEFLEMISRVLLRTVIIGVSILVVQSSKGAVAASLCSDVSFLIEETYQDFAGIIVEPRVGGL